MVCLSDIIILNLNGENFLAHQTAAASAALPNLASGRLGGVLNEKKLSTHNGRAPMESRDHAGVSGGDSVRDQSEERHVFVGVRKLQFFEL